MALARGFDIEQYLKNYNATIENQDYQVINTTLWENNMEEDGDLWDSIEILKLSDVEGPD